MAAAKKKVDVGEVTPLPKPFEVGYKFLVEAEIVDLSTDYGDEAPYQVSVGLCSAYDNGRVFTWYSKEELISLISKGNPKFKKDYITQQLKDAKALVASLEKQLAAN